MKNIVLKTVFLTLGVVIVLAISVFGIASLTAPVQMMEFTASIGLKGISSDYAYQEYERSGDISCLARAFLLAAQNGNARTANERFDLLYADDEFASFCEEQNGEVSVPEGLSAFTYRGYVCGLAARMKYRLSSTDEEKAAVLAFAVSETDKSFSRGNPLIALSTEAARAGDRAFCDRIVLLLEDGGYERNTDFQNIIKILEDGANA